MSERDEKWVTDLIVECNALRASLTALTAEVGAVLDGRVWRDAQPAYRRLYAAWKKASAAIDAASLT